MPRLSDADCAQLLAWAGPRLGLSAPGFSRVRGQVRKRIGRRIAQLGLAGLAAYRARLEEDAAEWDVLDALCRVTITRFYRDGPVFDRLFEEWLPERARYAHACGRTRFRAFCAGCASGEEPYTLAIGWHARVAPRVRPLTLEVLAQDADPVLLARAAAAAYPRGAFREMPRDLFATLDARDGEVSIPPRLRACVTFRRADVRESLPAGPFDLILCRNLAFTYFAPAVQEELLARLTALAADGALLVIGKKEALPAGHAGWSALDGRGTVLARS